MRQVNFIKILMLIMAVMTFFGCRKIFNLPDEVDYFSNKADYTNKTFRPRLGRTTVTTNYFNADASSYPMKFEIKNARFGDGRDASDMLELKPTLVWIAEYNGEEKSIAEIEAKRKLENRPMLELRGSGDIIMWYTATRALIRPSDSVVYPQDIRYIDVKVSNSGGSKLIRDIAIIPGIDVPYEPSADYNTITGKPNTSSPGGSTLVYNYPSISNITGESTNVPLTVNDVSKGIVRMYIRKYTNNPNGSTLRFKFLNKDSVAIDPAKFNETKWDEQVHGFNMEMTREYVKYDVAYPIPLARIGTSYTAGGKTGGGDNARVEFSFSRMGFGETRQLGRISQNFKIYEKGDWEIVFHFKTVNPKFDND